MTKVKKRNELSIFEELKLKPKIDPPIRLSRPLVYKLKKLTLLCRTDENNKPLSWWRKRKNNTLVQSDQFGQPVYDTYDNAEKTPKKKKLVNYENNLMVAYNKYGWAIFWWRMVSKDKLIQIDSKGNDIKNDKEIIPLEKDDNNNFYITRNVERQKNTDNESSIEFEIKSLLRNKAIEAVGLEIRTLKKKAYEYSKEELMKMIEIEEKKIIKKQGIKWLRRLALTSLGIGFIPGL